MPAKRVTAALKRVVMARACGLCEYCRSPARFATQSFTVEHITPRARAAIAPARDRLLKNADKIVDPSYKKSFLENVPENARTLRLARAWLGEGAVGV
jgi:hypothetical protein